jgi:hypothetical protein
MMPLLRRSLDISGVIPYEASTLCHWLTCIGFHEDDLKLCKIVDRGNSIAENTSLYDLSDGCSV